MQRYSQQLVICSLLTSTFALSLPPLDSISQNSNHPIDLPMTPSLNLTAGRNHCTTLYGKDLSPVSCENAWDKVSRSTTPQTYRTQWHGKTQLPNIVIPIRFLSDDGLCAIDITNTKGRVGDISTGLEISQKARQLLDDCVYDKRRGGSITGFSK